MFTLNLLHSHHQEKQEDALVRAAVEVKVEVVGEEKEEEHLVVPPHSVMSCTPYPAKQYTQQLSNLTSFNNHSLKIYAQLTDKYIQLSVRLIITTVAC